MKALALFGSTARYEREIDSDIDLLGVYENNVIHNRSSSLVNIYLYPEKTLIEKMESGDLFALHLVKESLPIYGDELLSDIFSNFKYKENYLHEISIALFISKILIDNYDSIKNKDVANKKLSWCIRTAIIAISAQDRNPVFSKKSLAEYLTLSTIKAHEVLHLINSKRIKYSLPVELIDNYSIFFRELSELYNIDSDSYMDPIVSDILIKVGLLASTKKESLNLYS